MVWSDLCLGRTPLWNVICILDHILNMFEKPPSSSKELYYRRGQDYAVDSISPISVVFHFKLKSTVILKELYSIEKCAICLDNILRF